MSPWQVLRAGRSSRVMGYCVHHGPRVSVHHNTAATAPEGSSSFLSREKLTLQQLNRRLASYLQQVLCLEAANQRLQNQIQQELDGKCPRDLSELDGHLRTASLLQEQISECLSAQAQVKLQLLDAELTIFDFNTRCEEERQHRGRLETELNNLRQMEEELKVHKLPELQRRLSDQAQRLTDLQIRQQQDRQGLLVQVSEGVAVKMQIRESSDLLQQLDNLRPMKVLNKNQNICWINAQVPLLGSPEVTFDPAEAELVELRRTTVNLERELTRLRDLNILLEESGQELDESLVLQLKVLQQRADSLGGDLDSVLQAAAQQAAEHQVLVDASNRLENEIQGYKRLLDKRSGQGVVSAPVENLHMKVSRGHMLTAAHTPLVIPLSETLTTHPSHGVQRAHQENSTLTSHLTDSFHNPENLRAESFPERTKKSITVGPNGPGSDKGAAAKVSKTDINPATTRNIKVPDTHSDKRADVQNKPETYSQIKIPKTTLSAEKERKEGPHFVTDTKSSDLSKEVKETMALPEVDQTEGDVHTKKLDPTQVMSLNLETPSETNGGETALVLFGANCCRSEDVQGEASSEVTLMNDKDVEREVKEVNKERERAEGALVVPSLDLNLSNMSISRQNKVKEDTDTEDTDTEDVVGSPSSGISVSNNNLESKTASTDMLKTVELETDQAEVVNSFHDTSEVKMATTESLHLSAPEALLTKESTISTSLTDSGVALSSSDAEELLSPTITDVFLSPTETEPCSSPIETQLLKSITEHACPHGELEDHSRGEDSLLSPKDPEMNLDLNESDTVETKGNLSPYDEEDDDEACLSLTEANIHVRPVEKYILSTKEEGQCSSFPGEQSFPDEGRNRRVTISMRDEQSLSFDSFRGKEGSRGTVSDLKSSIEWLDVGDRGSCSIIADKEEELGFEGLYQKGVRDARSPRDRYKDLHSAGGNKDIESSGVSPGGWFGSEDQRQTGREGGHVAAAGFRATAPNSSSTVGAKAEAAKAGAQGRFGCGGEWLVYGGSLGQIRTSTSRTESEGNLASDPVTSPTEIGRFGSRGTGGWRCCGGTTGHVSSLASSTSLPTLDHKDRQSADTHLAPSPAGGGRFGRGEWRVYGGSVGRLGGAGGADGVCTNESRLSSSSVVRRSNSVGSAGKFSSSSGSSKISSCKLTSSSSADRRPVYSPATRRRSSVGAPEARGLRGRGKDEQLLWARDRRQQSASSQRQNQRL